MEDYYTVNDIMWIIKNYHRDLKTIKEYAEDEFKSVGVAKYGLESSLPKGNSISAVVENEVLRRIENSKYFAERKTDIKYLQDRWDRITDEKEAIVLNHYLSGCTTADIAHLLGMTRWGVHKVLERIAIKIKSYPQDELTNYTNSEIDNLS